LEKLTLLGWVPRGRECTADVNTARPERFTTDMFVRKFSVLNGRVKLLGCAEQASGNPPNCRIRVETNLFFAFSQKYIFAFCDGFSIEQDFTLTFNALEEELFSL
jgi:hypothetical protein